MIILRYFVILIILIIFLFEGQIITQAQAQAQAQAKCSNKFDFTVAPAEDARISPLPYLSKA
jgi:hypothetical protein